MLALLVPLLALFPAAHSLPAHQDFKEPVRINFNLNNQAFPKFGWVDNTQYLDTENRTELTTNLQKPDNDTVGVLNLRSTEDIRVIIWTKEMEGGTARNCTISLTGDPQTPSIDVDLENEKVADNQIETAELLKVDCKNASPPTSASTATNAVSTQAEATGVPWKTPLLVTFLAKPNHVIPDVPSGGWLPNTENGGIQSGSFDSTAEEVLSNDTQVRLGWVKFEGTTDQEWKYMWSGNLENGPVFKQCSVMVIADLNVPDVLIWADSGEFKLGEGALHRQSFFHYCNTTLQDGRVIGPDGEQIQPSSSVIQQ